MLTIANHFDAALIESSDDIREVVNVAQINPRLVLQGQEFNIIGKVITSSTMSRGQAERFARQIWGNNVGDFELRKKSKNLFTVKFETKEEWKWVLSEAPWCLDGFLWIIKPWNPTQNYGDMSFDKQQFWVIFKDLPREFLNVFVAREMGLILGEVLELDPDDANPVETNDV
ncbi:hypothetical protein C5167_038886 [Papaver somniferum]|uniref:DUF4283 domain-containing protein n=1 Tax=Papaver somniferum TaxID=3469 RepID=A0A4Y7IAH6_PAPSO|nr:hypothetical protein C5167_038886 [Papaver somniferum]